MFQFEFSNFNLLFVLSPLIQYLFIDASVPYQVKLLTCSFVPQFKYFFVGSGEEPLLGKVGSRDINSVAGVLKLYFRELQEPLFPVQLFDELIACSKVVVNGKFFIDCDSYFSNSLLHLAEKWVVAENYRAFDLKLSNYRVRNHLA
jgi:RhoGAP domain